MKMCEHQNCKECATYRIKYSIHGEDHKVDACKKHLINLLSHGLAYHNQLNFEIRYISPFEYVEKFGDLYEQKGKTDI